MEYLADEENQAYLQHRARKLDESQTEHQHEKEQMEADELAISVKKAKANEKQQREQEKAEKIPATQLIFDLDVIAGMSNAQLDEQLDAHRQWDKQIPIKARLKVKAVKLAALLASISCNSTDNKSRNSNGGMTESSEQSQLPVLGEHRDDQDYDSDYDMNMH